MKLDKRLLNQIQPKRTSLYLIVVLGLVGGVVTIFHAHVLARVITQVFLGGASLPGVAPFIVLLAVLIILRSSLQWLAETSASHLATRVKSDLRQRLFEHIQKLGPYFDKGGKNNQHRHTGELVNTAMEGVESLDAYISQYIPQLALSALVPVTILIFVFPLDSLSGLVLLLTAPLIPLFMILIGGLANSLTRRQWKTLSRLSTHFLDVIQGLTTLKIFGRSRAQIEVISKISDRYRQTTLGVLRVAFLSALVLELVATLSTAVVAVQIGLRLLYGYIDFESAFFVLLLAPEFYLPLRMLGTRFHAGMAGITAANRIFEILETPVPNNRRIDTNLIALPPSTISISFKDVHYTYPDGKKALDGISFEIPAGQKVALVGPSGAGKSTIARLLHRFLIAESGTICLSGKDLEEIPIELSRKMISWVPQNPYLFHTTIAENIRIGRQDASRNEIVAAAKLAYAHEFIEELPQGYETIVGERAQRLSGGQAQRVALARAFLKDAPILILDEATANLDPEHTVLIEDAIDRLMQGRTCLIIAHRLNTIRNADQILVVDKGRLIEAGTHEQLCGKSGLYQQLIEAGTAEIVSYPTIVSEDNIQPLNSIELQPAIFEPQISNKNFHQSPTGSISLRHLSHLLSFLTPFKGLVALSILLGFITIVSGIGLMSTSAYIIAAAALQPSIAALQVPIVGVRAFGVGRGVFRYLERYVSHDVTFRILARLRVWFYQALEPLAPARLIHYRSGDLLSRVIADINTLENFYLRAVSPPLVAALVVLLITAFMNSFHPSLSITTLAFLSTAGIFLPLLILVINRKNGERLLKSRSDLHAAFVDSIQGMSDLQAFSGEIHLLEKVAKEIESLSSTEKRYAWVNGMQTAAGNLIAHLATWTVLILAIPLVHQGHIQGVYLPVLVLAVLTSFEAVYPLPLTAQHIDSNLQAARRLMEIVDIPPAVRDLDNPLPLKLKQLDDMLQSNFGNGSRSPNILSPPLIIFEDISFCYTSDESPALKKINLTLHPGQIKAVVGPSGSGKTTLINLLLRFWEYQQGRILINNQNIRHFHQDHVRQMFAVVTQNTQLFNATISENLLIANPKATQSELVQAARLAQIHNAIQNFPHGYNTRIGEEGIRLSGGERQRLAIARAILKNAPVLILDEFTANLDTITEKRIWQTIRTLMKGRSTLIISHRLYGLDDIDEILVLRNGCLIEQGRHEELLNKQGFYWQMWKAERNLLQ